MNSLSGLVAVALLATAACVPGAAADALDVHFPHNKPASATSPLVAAQVNVDEFKALASRLRASSGRRYFCEGHTSKPGTVSYNKKLAQRRCEFVKHHLVEAGLDRAVEPLAADVPAGCHGSGTSVVCGEAHASEDHAESRRIVARFVTSWKPSTCATYKCPAGQRRKPSSDTCTSDSDCKDKCCEFDSSQGCGSVTCPVGSTKVQGTVPCASKEECAQVCCQRTCSTFYDRFACPAPLRKKAGQEHHHCTDDKECVLECCEPTTCGMHRAMFPCKDPPVFPHPAPDTTKCNGEVDCRSRCCPLKFVPPPIHDGPTISNPPKPRDCERNIPCLGLCLQNKCGPGLISLMPTKGKGVCRDMCAHQCGGGKSVRACTNDAITFKIRGRESCDTFCR